MIIYPYTNIQTELAAEQARLKRYQEMYSQATIITDKIELNDRIFNQERTIKYLEESLKNEDQRVDYSTINFNLNEKQSEYINIALVKLSDLIRSLVDSFNSVLGLLFWIFPWAVLFILGKLGWKWWKKRK